jgi:hypothetical protein
MTSVDFGIVMAAIAGIVWLVRLEGRINLSDRLIAAMERRMEGLEGRIISELRDSNSCKVNWIHVKLS